MDILIITGIGLITIACFALCFYWASACIRYAMTGKDLLGKITTAERWGHALFSLVPIGAILIGLGLLQYVEIK